MITHLSAPRGESVNDYISKDDFSLQYTSVDKAIQMALTLGKGALLAKVDLKTAFRMVPVRPQDWELLGIRWRDRYYVDTCLPFGLRSAAPYLFNEVADTLQWIVQHNYHISHLIHYLDDYLMAEKPRSLACQEYLDCFLRVCTTLGVPVAFDKVDGPATTITFLGLDIDTDRQEIRLPPDKLANILAELAHWQTRRKATKRQLQSIIGKLAFVCRAVPAGRLFL